MAHNLNETARGVAFAFVEKHGHPWHRLGTPVPELMTTKEAIVHGKLDYIVEKQPLIAFPASSKELEKIRKGAQKAKTQPYIERKGILVPANYATVRTDTDDVLGIVGASYHVVQNVEVFKFFDNAIEDGAALIDTVGALGKGEVIFAVAKIPEEVEITDGDPIEHYLVLTNSHDGSRAIQAFFTAIRVVCQNTLMAAMRGAKNVVSLKHTSGVEANLAMAHRLLDTSKNYWSHVREAYAWMARRQMKTADANKFLATMFPAKVTEKVTGKGKRQKVETVEEVVTRTQGRRETVLNLFEGFQKGADKLGRTRWAMYNAFTQYIDHERMSRTGIDLWENSMFGGGANERQKAFDLLTDTMPRDYDLLVEANKN